MKKNKQKEKVEINSHKKTEKTESKKSDTNSNEKVPTDRMIGLKVDITTTLHSEIVDKLSGCYLKLLFKGESVDASLINGIRRIMLTEIPIYAVSESTTIIEKNTTNRVFDNDFVRQRLSMITVKGVKSKVKYLQKDYYPYVCGPYGRIYPKINGRDIEQKKSPNDKYDVKLYLNVSNKTQNVLDVTTNDFNMFINGEKQKNPYDNDNPGILLQLKSGQEFKSVSTAVLGIAKLHASWASIAGAIHEQLKPNKYLLTITALDYDRQLDEYTCFKKACNIIIMKLSIIKDSFESQIKAAKLDPNVGDNKSMILEIEGEDHTMGSLISVALCRHKNVIISGYCMPHTEEDSVKVGLTISSGSMKKIINDVFEYLLELLSVVRKQVMTLRSNSEYIDLMD